MRNSFKSIELPDLEVSFPTGVFLNSVTKTIWELSVKDGELMLDVPNFSFQIFPLSSTRFRPVNSLINLEIEFEKHAQNEPLFMHLYAKGLSTGQKL